MTARRENSAVREAERHLRLVSRDMTDPRPRECLACFVARQLEQHGCDNQLRWAGRFRDLRAPKATGLERRLSAMGGFCDCEIFLNAFVLAPEHLVWEKESGGLAYPDRLPVCRGVRASSTQPCEAWLRQTR